ncbi:hypothetical protein BKA67DRAFT_533660 [Truncatella angustata]|uniref:Uncharacterized protein n=1 Tax=Truncatella angustata TaxID=152316 RepID=A0A9P8UUX1_9PEZI|nr:uncharacterized protein BKA67DRAFT_533660 [Truncatella angustata]KAH6658507.1 hypothetical protein BKA67DRAFT_533660 [Truncatella angustata]KAH8196697.1 hypothetical protein TruAng_009126 [Truncatella angustata]
MLSALLLASAAAVSAYNATGPYGVHITGKEDSAVDGYAGACHAGAAIEGLCFIDGALNGNETYQQFYFNASGYDFETGAPSSYGWLEWELQFTSGENGEIGTAPSALQIFLNLGSNVNTALFYPGIDEYTSLQKADDGTLFISGGVDDSSFNSTYPNPTTYLGNLTNWHLCYQYTGGYYYQSIAWVTTQPPHNPSCVPVDLTLEQITY